MAGPVKHLSKHLQSPRRYLRRDFEKAEPLKVSGLLRILLIFPLWGEQQTL